MVQGKAILVVDLGNSSTKATVLYGKTADGKFREREFELPNVFAPVEDDYIVPNEYSDISSTVFNIEDELIGGDYCCGELQTKEFYDNILKPTAMVKKYSSDVTKLSYRLAFIHAYKALMKMTRTSDVSQLDITWSVVTLLPPGDISIGKPKIEKIVKDITEVNCKFPKMRMDIKVDKVNVLPEGFCAYVGVVFSKGKEFRPDYRYLTNEKVMILDIGAGTTDCMLIEENKIIQVSKYTITQGGNNVYQIVKTVARQQGLDLTDAAFQKAMLTGRVRDGAKTLNIAPIINKAKSQVAGKILNSFQDYLEGCNINLRDVGYVLVCGGGSIQDTNNEEILPLSKQIIERVKRNSPETLLIDIPSQKVYKEDEDGDDVVETEEPISPRKLNLIGASIMAETI